MSRLRDTVGDLAGVAIGLAAMLFVFAGLVLAPLVLVLVLTLVVAVWAQMQTRES